MKPFSIATALLGLVSSSLVASAATETTSRTSKINLPVEFKPPQVFKNVNLVHIVSLEKIYVKEQINIQIENVASQPQDEYFLPFTALQLSRVGGLEVQDRKDASAGSFVVEVVEYDSLRYVTTAPNGSRAGRICQTNSRFLGGTAIFNTTVSGYLSLFPLEASRPSASLFTTSRLISLSPH